jgi:predicted Rossmann fold flavoprotein
MKVAIIGGGAAGFFSAIHVKENFPDSHVVIFEKSSKLLSKVKISGGGRCNLTNACVDIDELIKAYPRGNRFLKKAFYSFNTKDTYNWFESKGVPLITQDDNCVFPRSQKSQSIIDLFLDEARRLHIVIRLKKEVSQIQNIDLKINIFFKDESSIEQFDKVIVTTGGSPQLKSLLWLEKLNHIIEKPVPSLFTFNIPSENITKLMGLVVQKTILSIQGTKLESKGSLLITHWGMSGPAVIKLSSLGARILNEKDYHFKIQINWVNKKNNQHVYNTIESIIKENPNKKLSNFKPYALPERLWLHLLEKLAFPKDKKWNELGKKGCNRLVNILTNDSYTAQGKSSFKEEFVTCGGVSLKSINHKTMESKSIKNLYFAGEVLDIDGITGGYNFQAAWTTAFIAAKLN